MMAPRRRATTRRARNLRALARGPGADIGPPDRIFLQGARQNWVKTSKISPPSTDTLTSGRLPTPWPQSHCPRRVTVTVRYSVTTIHLAARARRAQPGRTSAAMLQHDQQHQQHQQHRPRLDALRRHIAAPAADRGASGGPAEAHDGAASTTVTVAPSSAAPRRPRVAAIVTAYFPQSHADVVVSKLITGYSTDDGFVAPSVDVVSLYIDQVVLPAFDNHVAPEAQTASLTTPGGRNPADIGLGIAAAHGIPVYSTIPRALYEGDHLYAEGGSTTLDIDGVIMIVRVPPLPLQDPSHHLRLSRTYDCAMITASDGRPATALHNASCRASMATTRRTSWDVAFTRSATSSSRSLVRVEQKLIYTPCSWFNTDPLPRQAPDKCNERWDKQKKMRFSFPRRGVRGGWTERARLLRQAPQVRQQVYCPLAI
jgi:hypothetical protein